MHLEAQAREEQARQERMMRLQTVDHVGKRVIAGDLVRLLKSKRVSGEYHGLTGRVTELAPDNGLVVEVRTTEEAPQWKLVRTDPRVSGGSRRVPVSRDTDVRSVQVGETVRRLRNSCLSPEGIVKTVTPAGNGALAMATVEFVFECAVNGHDVQLPTILPGPTVTAAPGHGGSASMFERELGQFEPDGTRVVPGFGL